MPLIPGTLVKADDALDRAVRNALKQEGVQLQTPSRKPLRHALKETAVSAEAGYNGPWALRYDPINNSISCNGGYLNRNGAPIYIAGRGMDMPHEKCVIGIRALPDQDDKWKDADLSSASYLDGGGYDVQIPEEDWFFAPIGLWDYDNRKIEQWHFSPVLSIIVSVSLDHR